jgi:hypothetical protein
MQYGMGEMSSVTIQMHKYEKPFELYFDALDHSRSGYTYNGEPDKGDACTYSNTYIYVLYDKCYKFKQTEKP